MTTAPRVTRSEAARILATETEERPCAVCGAPLRPGGNRGRYCSRPCKYRARATRDGRRPRSEHLVEREQRGEDPDDGRRVESA